MLEPVPSLNKPGYNLPEWQQFVYRGDGDAAPETEVEGLCFFLFFWILSTEVSGLSVSPCV